MNIFKNELNFDLDKEMHFRKDMQEEIAKYYDLAELNYYKFHFYLNNIVNNIKHRDHKFYKRYENKNYKEILNESNLLFRELKEYIRNIILMFYFTRVRINYLVEASEGYDMAFLSDFNL